ncbi:MAG: arginine deiminase [Coprococcus sp.]|nr:arginine deiminase [Coprococcus sp.]
MSIEVKSEIGKLKKVMLHRPGKELEHLVPREMERLLFDDIPYLKTARQEHDCFAAILQSCGAEVVYLEDLMTETLKACPHLKRPFVREFINEGGVAAQRFREPLEELLLSIESEQELVLKTMSGVAVGEIGRHTASPLVSLVRSKSRFLLDPIPNLYFTRDSFSCIGNGVSLNRMYSQTRRRETLFGKYILENHPDFKGKIPFYYRREYPFSVEGGDILNLNSQVLAVGISQRTTPEGIEKLAQDIFADPKCEIRTILALDIPSIRAYMHLDTVLTQIDHDKFTIHPEILGSLQIYELTPGKMPGGLCARELTAPLAEVLAEKLHLDQVTMIRCGGMDRVASEREQWNDGSNTLCVSPGTVVVYDRNYITNGILRDNGIHVLEMPSSELSRGRGGPRCMSMPLIREPI